MTRLRIKHDNLFIGVDAGKLFNPDMIYEVVNFDGELVIREVGLKPLPYSISTKDANNFIENYLPYALMTDKELGDD